MQYALVSNERTSPSPGLNGHCPFCSHPMIAKCGTLRVHHWAHRAQLACDPWWERETEWHRSWKANFPENAREVIAYDRSVEKHIADVRTDQGLVIEFQHSHLSGEERQARERFYKNMIWVIDGTRLIRDFPRFERNVRRLRPSAVPRAFLAAFPEEYFPKAWLDSSVPVVFDFRFVDRIGPDVEHREWLWCLLPGRAEGFGVVARMSRSGFLDAVSTRPRLFSDSLVPMLAQGVKEEQEREWKREFAERRRHYKERIAREYGGRPTARF